MPKTIEVKVEGFDELRRAMKALSAEVRDKHLGDGIGAGALVIQKEAKALAPVRSGKLKRAIYRKRLPNDGGGAVQWIVGVRRGKKYQSRTLTTRRGKTVTTTDRDAYYWTHVEFGHIARGPGQRITGGFRSKRSKREQLRAGGATVVAARPFMRPAFERRKGDAVEVIRKRLAVDLAKALPGFTPA